MDNLHPYLLMPSRASAGAPGGFSYYEHVVLPESEKTLMWEMDGRRYRSQLVIRSGGRRRTEAYLFAWDDGAWRPAVIADGTVSDGRCDSYSRCVESICGSAETFFTSVFAAQGRRHLSQYRNAEIKWLLADLLGLDEIEQLGSRAQEVVRGLKAGLSALRMRQSELAVEESRVKADLTRLHGAEQGVTGAVRACDAARSGCDAARLGHARLLAEQSQSSAIGEQRARLEGRLRLAAATLQRSEAEGQRQQDDLRERTERLDRRVAQRIASAKARREAVEVRLRRGATLVADATHVASAERRLPFAQRIVAAWQARMALARVGVEQATRARDACSHARQRLGAIEQAAGKAALREQELTRRFGLVGSVPCSGLPLQGRCQLLGDAREAAILMPSARGEIERLANERSQVLRDIEPFERQLAQSQSAADRLRHAERRFAAAARRETALGALAGRKADLLRAQEDHAALLEEVHALQLAESVGESDDERTERQAIAAGLAASTLQRHARHEAHRAETVAIEQLLAMLPPRFDVQRLVDAAAHVTAAQRSLAEAERAHAAALADVHKRQAAEAERSRHEARRVALGAHIDRVQNRLADWLLFARCMSHDGLIALAIEDAGPALSGLANDLLLACYGARFIVAIRTQVATAKGEAREGFDIEVHDAESGESKSVLMMSGGERVWINECLTRAVALYLAQQSGRRYSTLFCDEADGALDVDRKRMFMAMKRKVLELGGYEREFYVSQTPELTAAADAVIDLDDMASDGSQAAIGTGAAAAVRA
ncbi:DNA repair protein [Methylibium petroleiphilum]|uniref:DNA repair protein n=1 Tax=Methylibium petroleiphilum TaxID=105560 RepID=UPI0023539955|nr:DNA repair protein [Methylibium petroleiphilum]